MDPAPQVSTELQRAIDTMDKAMTPVYVSVDGFLVAIAGFGDSIRADALASLQALRAAGWHTVLLSGDTPSVAQAVGGRLKFAPSDVIGGATPEDKRQRVEQFKREGRVVLVGDGVNDAAAIAAAAVGAHHCWCSRWGICLVGAHGPDGRSGNAGGENVARRYRLATLSRWQMILPNCTAPEHGCSLVEGL